MLFDINKEGNNNIIPKHHWEKCISEYDLKRLKGKIHIMRQVMIPPVVTTVVKGIVHFTTQSKCMNAVVEPVMGYSDHITMASSYGVLKPGKGKIIVCL